MPVKKIFSNQQKLRKKIDDLNGMLKTMEQQKVELLTVLRFVEGWSEDLRNVTRTNLGVPYIRAVKQTLGNFLSLLKLTILFSIWKVNPRIRMTAEINWRSFHPLQSKVKQP